MGGGGAGEKDSDDMSIGEEETNDHIKDINTGGGEGDDEEVKSPEKKKKKKEKKSKKKSVGGGDLILKKGRFSTDSVGVGQAKETMTAEVKEKAAKAKAKQDYNHKHKRVVLEASLVCSKEGKDAKYDEFTLGMRALFKNMQKVDATVVIEPVLVGSGKKLVEPSEIPFNHTEMGKHIQQTGGNKSFDMRKPRKNEKKKGGRRYNDDEDEEGLVDPEVYCSLAISCDVNPQVVLDRVSCEWGRIGGNRLWVKEISSFTIYKDWVWDLLLA
jgi:hypothetical protein